MSNDLVNNITGVTQFNPDILETIADLSNDEVFTPPKISNDILDLLPEDVWHNPHLKWLDPAVKTGVFLREAAKRLMDGLANPQTNDTELKTRLTNDEAYRREWIYRKMLFGIAITELTSLMARRSLYYTKYASDPNLSVVAMETDDGNILFKELRHSYDKDKKGNLKGSCLNCGASLDWHRKEELESHAYAMLHASKAEIIAWFKELNSDISDEVNMKFDVIIGNPPYQLNDGGGTGSSATPLYHKFIEQAISFEPSYISMIVPSRWFAGGKGLDDFRAKMLQDKRISHIVDFPNSVEVFPSVEIKGGVNYFLWDASYKGNKCHFTLSEKNQKNSSMRNLAEFEKIIRVEKDASIVNKITKHNDFTPLAQRVSARKPFGLRADFKEFDKVAATNKIKIYANQSQGYVEKAKVPKIHESFSKYKVIVSKAGSGGIRPDLVTSAPILINPTDICTETYLVLNWFNTENEGKNMLLYSKTRFFRYLLSTLKVTQNISREKFEYVPDLDMTQSWDDVKLYKHFNLTQDEIDHIEESIRTME
jgi:site-specific DNA-methyltransferase (adenine-specific)